MNKPSVKVKCLSLCLLALVSLQAYNTLTLTNTQLPHEYRIILPFEGLSAKYKGHLETWSKYTGTEITDAFIDLYVGSELKGSIIFSYMIKSPKAKYPKKIEFLAYEKSRRLTIIHVYPEEMIPLMMLPFDMISPFWIELGVKSFNYVNVIGIVISSLPLAIYGNVKSIEKVTIAGIEVKALKVEVLAHQRTETSKLYLSTTIYYDVETGLLLKASGSFEQRYRDKKVTSLGFNLYLTNTNVELGKHIPTEYDKLKMAYAELEKNFESLQANYNVLKGEHKKLVTAFDELQHAYNKSTHALQDLQVEYRRMARELNSTKASYNFVMNITYALAVVTIIEAVAIGVIAIKKRGRQLQSEGG